jgi:hypothetical protein
MQADFPIERVSIGQFASVRLEAPRLDLAAHGGFNLTDKRW